MIDTYRHETELNFGEACQLPAKLNEDCYLGHCDWLLPNIDQLKLLQMSDLAQSDRYYWSTSPYLGQSLYSWYVDFSNGIVDLDKNHVNYYVMLVRSSQLLTIGQVALAKIMVAG